MPYCNGFSGTIERRFNPTTYRYALAQYLLNAQRNPPVVGLSSPPLSKGELRIDAIQFNRADPAGPSIHAAFRLAVNEYNGVASIQLMLEHFETA